MTFRPIERCSHEPLRRWNAVDSLLDLQLRLKMMCPFAICGAGDAAGAPWRGKSAPWVPSDRAEAETLLASLQSWNCAVKIEKCRWLERRGQARSANVSLHLRVPESFKECEVKSD